MTACPLVAGTGVDSFRAMSKGMSGGSFQLKTTLGSLSVDGQGCVPTLLVVWPKVPQNFGL